MDILDILYTVTIGPLKLLFEVIFSCANMKLNNPGLSIICLSFALNLILLPLYMRAEKIQKKENDTQLKLKDGVDHIKKAFKGDEQYMILQTYYRKNNYKPIYSLRSLSSLLLQIPFFLAASGFLSNLKLLNGTSFFIIKDLGAPDHLLFGLNLLPIAMTLINLFNCIVYTKGQPFKSKIQLYLMALVFLVLLYNSPAGLSFYYLLNNVFSLIKNIFLKIKNKEKALGITFVFGSVGLTILALFILKLSIKIKIIVMLVSIVLLIIGICLLKNIKISKLNDIKVAPYSFLLATIFLCLLTGLFIPSKLINASPEEFIDLSYYVNPIQYIVYSFSLALGTFVIWFNIYYYFMKDNIRKIMSILIYALCFICLVNYLFFGTNLGTISNTLVYDEGINYSLLETILNIFAAIIVLVIVITLYMKKYQILKYLTISVCCVFVVLSSINGININNVSKQVYKMNQENNLIDNMPEFNFSKNGKNVIVLMLDRAIGSYLPYIMEEKPELQEQFKGFTYYPNTISFGAHTNFSTPSLFGGYEYTPIELNKRDTELLEDKHNEALLMMPRLFSDNGFNVKVCDPPYAGYKEIPDLSIYDGYDNIDAYITKNLFFMNTYLPEILKRNLFCFTLTKSSLLPLQSFLYNKGRYLKAENQEGISADSIGYMRDYSVLQNLINITSISNNDKNNVLLLQNSCTHDNIIGKDNITNYGKSVGLILDGFNSQSHYYVNVKTLLELGKWFDYLRDNDVYDNTRIIICSDHSFDLGLYPDLVIADNQDEDLMIYNPLLMVKDFNSDTYSTDESFMTLADIPYLAINEIIDNPINPFTNKAIIKEDKNDKKYYIIDSNEYNISVNNGYAFLPSKWFEVHDDCRDINNWKLLEDINNETN